eukprot:1160698-Pelagomonas_calceolata.AAC.7
MKNPRAARAHGLAESDARAHALPGALHPTGFTHTTPIRWFSGVHRRILMRGRTPYLVPCTPLGCMQLLKRSGISVRGKSAVVVGDRWVYYLTCLSTWQPHVDTEASKAASNQGCLYQQAHVVSMRKGKG